WMRVADPMMFWAWLALAFYCSLYFPLSVWLLRRLDRLRLPFALTLPVVWVALEYVRSHFLTGFSWYFLGHTQHDYLALIQVTDLGGVYAVSLVVASINGLLFDVLTRSSACRRWLGLPETALPARRLAIAGAAVAILVSMCLGYGMWRLAQTDFMQGPSVA